MCTLTAKKGQVAIEYAVIIICIIGALLGMQYYGRRALQGRLRSSFDQIGEQYEPKKTSTDITTNVERDTTTEVLLHQPLTLHGVEGYGALVLEYVDKDKTTRHGQETVDEFGTSLWE